MLHNTSAIYTDSFEKLQNNSHLCIDLVMFGSLSADSTVDYQRITANSLCGDRGECPKDGAHAVLDCGGQDIKAFLSQ